MFSMLTLLVLQFEIVDFFGLLKNKIDFLTPLMTFDPNEKNTRVQHKNALFQFKLKNSLIPIYGDKNS